MIHPVPQGHKKTMTNTIHFFVISSQIERIFDDKLVPETELKNLTLKSVWRTRQRVGRYPSCS